MVLNSQFTLFVDGISLSMVIMTLVIILAAVDLFYKLHGRQKEPMPLITRFNALLTVGLVGVFIASNLLLVLFLLGTNDCSSILYFGQLGIQRLLQSCLQILHLHPCRRSLHHLRHRRHLHADRQPGHVQAAQLLMTPTHADIVKWIIIAVQPGLQLKWQLCHSILGCQTLTLKRLHRCLPC